MPPVKDHPNSFAWPFIPFPANLYPILVFTNHFQLQKL